MFALGKKESDLNLSKRGRIQKSNHCNKARQNRCEQRWSNEHISCQNCSQSRLRTHYRACNFISIEPKVDIEFSQCYCKSAAFKLEMKQKE